MALVSCRINKMHRYTARRRDLLLMLLMMTMWFNTCQTASATSETQEIGNERLPTTTRTGALRRQSSVLVPPDSWVYKSVLI